MRYHDAATIGDPRSTWGLLEGNPTQAIIRHNGSLVPLDFCVNVTLNRRREITALLLRPPDRGTRARLRVLEGDRDGRLRATVPGRRDDEQRLPSRPEPVPGGEGHVGRRADRRRGRLHRDRGAVQRRLPRARQLQDDCCSTTARPGSCSTRSRRRASRCSTSGRRSSSRSSGSRRASACAASCPTDEVRRAHLEPIADVGDAVARELRRLGDDAPVAVLPEGPQTIPYVG